MDEKARLEEVNDFPIDILLVEDDEADIEVTLRAFEKGKLKNNISVVRDGQEALDFIHHEGAYRDEKKYPRPDLILLDIRMPKMGGLEVLKKLKSESNQYSCIPVAMLTSSKNEEDIVQSYCSGAVGYIPKPVSYGDFTKVVDGFSFYWHIINKLPSKPPQ